MFLSELSDFIIANRSKGRREAFGFDGSALTVYLTWAMSFDYLFVVSSENGISGAGVAYPLPTPYKGAEDELFSFRHIVPRTEEHEKELCIMDWAADSKEGRKSLIRKFQKRYPNWENQKKWALQFGEAKEITNRYINFLNN